MQVISRVTIVVALIALLVGACDSESGSDSDVCADVECIPATNLDCENNWDPAAGNYGAGGLNQTLILTFTIPEDYDGEEYVHQLGAAFGDNNVLPSTDTPILVGEIFSGDEAGPLIPGQSFQITTNVFSRLGMFDEEPCGTYLWAGASVYYNELSFPAQMEWAKFSDVRYQVGGDTIVVDVGVLVSGDI